MRFPFSRVAARPRFRRQRLILSLSLVGTPATAPGQAPRADFPKPALDCVQSGLPGADPDRFLDVGDKYLAVADPPGLGGATDRVDGSFHHVVAKYDFDFDLGEEIHHVLGAAIEFRMSLLATEALGFRHRDALQTDLL